MFLQLQSLLIRDHRIPFMFSTLNFSTSNFFLSLSFSMRCHIYCTNIKALNMTDPTHANSLQKKSFSLFSNIAFIDAIGCNLAPLTEQRNTHLIVNRYLIQDCSIHYKCPSGIQYTIPLKQSICANRIEIPLEYCWGLKAQFFFIVSIYYVT